MVFSDATRKWEMCAFLVVASFPFFWFVKGNVCVFARYRCLIALLSGILLVFMLKGIVVI